MTQKLLCLCAICALLFVFATANVASAEDVGANGDPVAINCPCGCAFAPACNFNRCCPPVSYRVGLFGVIRPVVCAPACAPICTPVCAPVCPPVYRPVCVVPRYVCPTYRPVVTCPPYYCW